MSLEQKKEFFGESLRGGVMAALSAKLLVIECNSVFATIEVVIVVIGIVAVCFTHCMKEKNGCQSQQP